jgi:hypothetical protein
MHGNFADMPATHATGILYHCTDTGAIYFVNASGQTAVQFSAPSASRTTGVLGENITVANTPVGFSESGEIKKYLPLVGTTEQINISTASVANKGHCEKMDTDKFIVADGGTTDTISAVKIVSGIPQKVTLSSVDSAIVFVKKIDTTRALVGYATNVVVVTVDWTAMTISSGTPVSATWESTPTFLTTGIVEAETETFWIYYSGSTKIKKRKITVSGTVPTVEATQIDTGNNIPFASYGGFQIKDFGGGYASLFWVSAKSTTAPELTARFCKITPAGDGALAESSMQVVAGFGHFTYSNTAVIPVSKDKTFWIFVSNSAEDGFNTVSFLTHNHESTLLDSVYQTKLLGYDFIIGKTAAPSNASLRLVPVTTGPNSFDLYYNDGANISKSACSHSGNTITIGEPSIVVSTARILRPTTSPAGRNISFSTEAVILLSSNGNTSVFARGVTDEKIRFQGVLEAPKNTGEVGSVAMKGSIVSLSGISGGADVYFDTAVNQTGSGVKIGQGVAGGFQVL